MKREMKCALNGRSIAYLLWAMSMACLLHILSGQSFGDPCGNCSVDTFCYAGTCRCFWKSGYRVNEDNSGCVFGNEWCIVEQMNTSMIGNSSYPSWYLGFSGDISTERCKTACLVERQCLEVLHYEVSQYNIYCRLYRRSPMMVAPAETQKNAVHFRKRCNGVIGLGAPCKTTFSSKPCIDPFADCMQDITTDKYTCKCNTGYLDDNGDTAGGMCVLASVFDECTRGTDNCDANAACTNTFGSFTCTCYRGYNGDGVTCTDLDECVIGTNNCDANAACTNTVGSFTCACRSGYSGDGITCTDRDECTLGTDNCDSYAVCTNTVGSFTCACNAGYTGGGVTCTAENTGLYIGIGVGGGLACISICTTIVCIVLIVRRKGNSQKQDTRSQPRPQEDDYDTLEFGTNSTRNTEAEYNRNNTAKASVQSSASV